MNKVESSVMKGIAIILMYTHHLFYMTDRVAFYDVVPIFISQESLINLGTYGKICVALFSFISGYGLTKGYGKDGSKMKNIIYRVFRFQLSIFICLACALAVSVILGKHTYADVYMEEGFLKSVIYFFYDVLGISFLCGTPSYNGAWWYSSIAIWIMISIPVLNVVCERLGGVLLTGMFYVSHMLTIHCAGDSFLFNFFIYGLFFPMAGFTVAKYDFVLNKLKEQSVYLLVIGITCIIMGYYGFFKIDPYGKVVTMVTILGFVFLSIVLCKYKLSKAVFGFLGRNSKYMFLCHSFFLSYFFQEHIYSFKYPLLILIMIVLETVAISLLFSFFERNAVSTFQCLRHYLHSKRI